MVSREITYEDYSVSNTLYPVIGHPDMKTIIASVAGSAAVLLIGNTIIIFNTVHEFLQGRTTSSLVEPFLYLIALLLGDIAALYGARKWYNITYVAVREEGIEHGRCAKYRKLIPWKEIRQLSAARAGGYIIRSNRDSVWLVPNFFGNKLELLREIERNLPEQIGRPYEFQTARSSTPSSQR